MKKDIFFLIFVIIFIIGIGAVLFLAPKEPRIDYRPVDVGGGSITVEDQDQVDAVILDAELASPGFITIHRTISDAPAEIIGTSQYLETGVYEDLTIRLDAEMLAGFRYAALLHADNGDGVYETMEDLPVKVDDEVVRPYFVAIPEAVRTEFPGGETVEVEEGDR